MVCPSKQHDFSYEDSVQEKSAIWLKFRYQRDPIGNRITSTTTETGSPVIRNYTSNNLNQYTAIDSPAASPTYDDDGNMTNDGTWSLVWNGENRIITATKDTTVIEYKYDYMGRRVERKVTDGGSITSHKKYVWDGWNKIEELDGQDSNALLIKRVWGLDLTGSLTDAGGVGALLSEISLSPTPYTVYPLYDANGNISDYLDSTGTVQAHYEYSPFGKTPVATGPMAETLEYRFSTKPRDPLTGDYDYGLRDYDTGLGRWKSRDPIGIKGGSNYYSFLFNDFINWWEYIGLEGVQIKAKYISTVEGSQALEKSWAPKKVPSRIAEQMAGRTSNVLMWAEPPTCDCLDPKYNPGDVILVQSKRGTFSTWSIDGYAKNNRKEKCKKTEHKGKESNRKAGYLDKGNEGAKGLPGSLPGSYIDSPTLDNFKVKVDAYCRCCCEDDRYLATKYFEFLQSGNPDAKDPSVEEITEEEATK